jgi:hypothetical protein
MGAVRLNVVFTPPNTADVRRVPVSAGLLTGRFGTMRTVSPAKKYPVWFPATVTRVPPAGMVKFCGKSPDRFPSPSAWPENPDAMVPLFSAHA